MPRAQLNSLQKGRHFLCRNGRRVVRLAQTKPGAHKAVVHLQQTAGASKLQARPRDGFLGLEYELLGLPGVQRDQKPHLCVTN